MESKTKQRELYFAKKSLIIYNLEGYTCQIIDANGTVVVEYTYDAWGKVMDVTGTMAGSLGTIQPFRYRGYVYDVETGLYYLRSRYYNPEKGRFNNADTYLENLFSNIYTYCRNNPIILTDITGMLPDTFKSINDLIISVIDKIDQFYEYEKNLYESSSTITVFTVFGAAQLATEYTNTYFAIYKNRLPEELDGTVANAFKHACWNAFMVLLLDEQTAKEFADAHEYQSQNVVPDQLYLRYTEKIHSDMDLYFNQLGRDVAAFLGNGSCIDAVAEEVLKAVYHDTGHVLIRDYGNTLSAQGMWVLVK